MNTAAQSVSQASARNDAQMTPAQQRKIVFAAVIGNLLEFFDFTVYSYFALTIGKQFFPSSDPIMSSLLAFAVFAVGFVMRPLGGFVLGRYADRAGRKPALTLTILLMAVGSAAIGIAPTYAQIGPEMQTAFVQKLVLDARPVVDPKLQALDGKVRSTLGLPPAGAAASGAQPARPASAPKGK